MLDAEMCKRFGVKPFMQWIMKELDELEDLLHGNSINTSTEYAAISSRYNTLIQVRDAYVTCDQK